MLPTRHSPPANAHVFLMEMVVGLTLWGDSAEVHGPELEQSDDAMHVQ